jgi:hypothetical protein
MWLFALCLLRQHLFRRHSGKPAHDLKILLFAHLLVALAYLCQDLEVFENVCGARIGTVT